MTEGTDVMAITRRWHRPGPVALAALLLATASCERLFGADFWNVPRSDGLSDAPAYGAEDAAASATPDASRTVVRWPSDGKNQGRSPYAAVVPTHARFISKKGEAVGNPSQVVLRDGHAALAIASADATVSLLEFAPDETSHLVWQGRPKVGASIQLVPTDEGYLLSTDNEVLSLGADGGQRWSWSGALAVSASLGNERAAINASNGFYVVDRGSVVAFQPLDVAAVFTGSSLPLALQASGASVVTRFAEIRSFAVDGSPLWKASPDIGKSAQWRMVAVADDDSVIIASTGIQARRSQFRKLSPSGALVWTDALRDAAFPVPLLPGGGLVVFGSFGYGIREPGGVYALSSATGEMVWSALENDPTMTNPVPLIVDSRGTIVGLASLTSGAAVGYDFVAFGLSASGTLSWRLPLSGATAPSGDWSTSGLAGWAILPDGKIAFANGLGLVVLE